MDGANGEGVKGIPLLVSPPEDDAGNGDVPLDPAHSAMPIGTSEPVPEPQPLPDDIDLETKKLLEMIANKFKEHEDLLIASRGAERSEDQKVDDLFNAHNPDNFPVLSLSSADIRKIVHYYEEHPRAQLRYSSQSSAPNLVKLGDDIWIDKDDMRRILESNKLTTEKFVALTFAALDKKAVIFLDVLEESETGTALSAACWKQ